MTEISNISKAGKLVAEKEWSSYILSLRQQVKSVVSEEEKAISLLRQPLVEAVRKRIPKKRFGILFSGGVDSTLIAYLCKQEKADFICYTVGLTGSEDIYESKRAAEDLGFKHVIYEPSQDELETTFRRLAKILPVVDAVSIGVGSVVMAAIESAKKDGVDTFFGGLGSEEIFAGYQRHENSEDINDECWDGLVKMYGRDFIRDATIAAEARSTLLTPFLDKELILAAMSIDGCLKIKDQHKKYILRKLAISLGLPKEFALRPKKAAQYGSSFDKGIARIAKRNGFRQKKPYLDSLVKK